MRLLVFTTLFPRPSAPHHGIFVWERLRGWLDRHGGEAVVVAPVPWVPDALARGSYASYRGVPREQEREGVRILHPRYLLAPRIGMSSAPLTLAAAGRRALRRLRREGERFDLLDAHYLYPDAVAAAFVARTAGLPLVVTARGSDVSLLPRYRVPRAWLRWMLRRADGIVCVCQALKTALEPLGTAAVEPRVLPNGVDLEKFQPVPCAEARALLGWPAQRRQVLAVGHLIERKGHHHLVEALPALPEDVDVRIVGAGPEEGRLRRLVEAHGLQQRVLLAGPMAHQDLKLAYSAADVLALLSSREGWPNVLLEAMACGCPVVATRVWGTPEVVRSDVVGQLVDQPTPAAVADAIGRILAARPDGAAIRSYAELHSWARCADGMQEVFEEAVATAARPARPQEAATTDP